MTANRPAATPARPRRGADPATEMLAQRAAEFRTTVYLADIEGYACKEIASLMGTPVGTVVSRIHRARRQLRWLLRDHPAARQPVRIGPAHDACR